MGDGLTAAIGAGDEVRGLIGRDWPRRCVFRGVRRRAVDEAGRAYFRQELESLSTEISRALPKSGDAMTRAHLKDVRDQITKALEPKFLPAK